MIYHPATASEAVELRKAHKDTAVYLAGGTDALRLGSPNAGKDLIDLKGLLPSEILLKDGKLIIGAGCTLRQVAECDLVPEFLREAARFCASFVKRGMATVGGNLALRRQDSYLAAAFTAADASLHCLTPHGEKDEPVGGYLQKDCVCLVLTVTVDRDRKGTVKRFGNTAHSHAAVIAAQSGGICALSASGSDFAFGNDPSFVEAVTFTDDLTGSAAYKKHLAKTFFASGRCGK